MSEQAANAVLGLLMMIIIPLGTWQLIKLIYRGVKRLRQGGFAFHAHKSISNRDLRKRIRDAKKRRKK